MKKKNLLGVRDKLSESANILARILITGDSHLSSRNYGAHQNYPKETLHYFRLTTDMAKELGATHYIGLGDFTYGRFHSLEYREEVEKILQEQYEITNGNRWEIKGNHDEASYGKTEYEYYKGRGMIRGSEYIKIGNVNINMVDYGKYNETNVVLGGEDEINVILTHGYFVFNNTQMPAYGDPIYLDNFEEWCGVDYIICGHIHQEHIFDGYISNSEGKSHPCVVHYLPCLSRPAYLGELTPEVGRVVLLTIYDNGTMKYDMIDVPLLPIEQSFNLALKEKKKKHSEYVHVDVSDVVKQLASHQRTIGNPEDIIMAKADIPEKYRIKAVDLLKNATK